MIILHFVRVIKYLVCDTTPTITIKTAKEQQQQQ